MTTMHSHGFRFTGSTARSTWSADFVTSSLRRLTWRNLGLSLMIGLSLSWTQLFARNFNPSAWQVAALRANPGMAGDLLPELLAAASQCIAALIATMAANEAIDRGVRPLRANVSGVFAGGLFGALTALSIGAVFQSNVGYKVFGALSRPMPLVIASMGVLNVALVTLAYRRWESMRAAQRKRHEAELARAVTRRRAVESSLQAMQARVEPDFLFSTLDLILRRFESQPDQASAMLDDLADYLRAALPHLRVTTSTVAKELALSQAFINLVNARSSCANTLSITMTPDVAAASFPPMILLPLVNALMAASDGRSRAAAPIRLSGKIVDDVIYLTVEGPADALRVASSDRLITESTNRLRALYGEQMRLSVERHWTDATHDGIRLRLELPHEATDRDHR